MFTIPAEPIIVSHFSSGDIFSVIGLVIIFTVALLVKLTRHKRCLTTEKDL